MTFDLCKLLVKLEQFKLKLNLRKVFKEIFLQAKKKIENSFQQYY